MKNAFSIKIGNEIINFESIDEIKNKEEYFDNTVELLFDGKKVFTGKYEDCISLLEYYKSYEEGQKVLDVICDLKDELSISEYKLKLNLFRSVVFLIGAMFSILFGSLITTIILIGFTCTFFTFSIKKEIDKNKIRKELLTRSKILNDIKSNTKKLRDKVKNNEEKSASKDKDKTKNISYVNVDGLNDSKVYYKKF